MGNQPNQRAFFLPPYHSFLKFKMGNLLLDSFHSLPDFIPLSFTIRTSDNVQVKVDMRISFQLFDPQTYTKKPIDFYTQTSFWVQNALLDEFAQQNFRDFLKHYAQSARAVTEASHATFNEFGIKILDVQLIHFNCLDPETQKLLDQSESRKHLTRLQSVRLSSSPISFSHFFESFILFNVCLGISSLV